MELTLRTYDSSIDPIPYDLLLSADPSKEMVDAYYSRGLCTLAYLGDRLVGEFVLLPTRPATVEIVNIAVDEQSQGQGIGTRLVHQAIHEASRLGAKTIEIGTGNSSVMQLYLYQKCGFRIVGVDVDFFVRHYDEPIEENGIPCRDMIRLAMDLPHRI
ncbi:GNAT family N-acetyltransferase [Paenibacillus guangzhouensis]|uniref:GNAT family N-acetyltransferase n=1 Tax=Paenibacillus guangzhouensis TaxID=1473112 RepID=UPI00126695BC|nr:GNAT family N-acetyltransferase [Paenibacillus guangzhouensis]